MATLENYVTGEKIILRSCHVFGRFPQNVNTVVESMDVSNLHATIRWEDSIWKILDHSRNGTWINGNRITSRKGVVLKNGTIIQFGGGKSSAWIVLDLEEPRPLLVPVEGNGPFIKLEQFQILPNDQSAEVAIYLNSMSMWMRESQEGEAILKDGDLIHFDNRVWRFFNPMIAICTQSITGSDVFTEEELFFVFHVSPDEEHVSVKAMWPDKSLDLGVRAHHYLLLTLARQRLKEAKGGIDFQSQGWIEFQRLSKMLALDSTNLNCQVFRARQQVARTLPKKSPYPAQIIERRPGELRFGFPQFKIFRGSSLEGELSELLKPFMRV